MLKHLFILAFLVLIGCSSDNDKSDAFGNFEAEEVIISSEGIGTISGLTAEEGDRIEKGTILGQIDTMQLYLQKQQVIASMTAIASRRQDVQVQVNVLEERRRNLVREKSRLENLIKDGAATQKQIDDITGEIEVIGRNILATKMGLETTNSALTNELKPHSESLRILDDKIAKCRIVSPITGTIVTKYSENGEFASIGKPIIKLADIDNIYLKAYVSGAQLADIKLGMGVKILVDKGKDDYYFFEGKVSWISPKAEFTPKIIQTKDERVNLVYAFKVLVKNDGKIKIGMPGEVKLK
jgi:HlyD family secretion protein